MSEIQKLPELPTLNEIMEAANPSFESLSFLTLRRSTPIKCISNIGPSADDLESILQIASRVPDHRKLEPWRFIILSGDARHEAGEKLADIRLSENPSASDAEIQEDKERFLRTANCVAVISSPVECSKQTPVWEQELSAGALCMNILLTANAAGWAGAWLTEWCTYSSAFKSEMGLSPTEKFAGFIYLGRATANPPERQRPNISSKITYWTK